MRFVNHNGYLALRRNVPLDDSPERIVELLISDINLKDEHSPYYFILGKEMTPEMLVVGDQTFPAGRDVRVRVKLKTWRWVTFREPIPQRGRRPKTAST